MKKFLLCTLALLFVVLSGWAQITIEMVTVGNPGNSDDVHLNYPVGNSPFGAVSNPYQIGKYEVTSGQYCAFLNAAAKSDPFILYWPTMQSNAQGPMITRSGSSGSYTYDFSGAPSGTTADWENRPIRFVSWQSAARFCNWMTSGNTELGAYNTATWEVNRSTALATYSNVIVLPTEDEWYKAAYYDPNKPGGAGYWNFPTKSDVNPSVAVTDDGITNRIPASVATYNYANVGTFISSPGPYGTYDQAGNAVEWTESWTCYYPTDVINKIARGGYIGDELLTPNFLSAETEGRSFAYANRQIPVGFRVAIISQPTQGWVDPGFTPGSCGGHVYGYDAFTTIQACINAVANGGTVNVAAGTYLESNILVDKTLTIQGLGSTRDEVVIAPAAEDANVDNAFGSSAQNGFVIKAHNVTIKNLTIDGRGNALLTAGKNNFRTGIVTLDASQIGGGAWNNLHVDNVFVKYAYRRGISVFPTTVNGTVIENSRIDNTAFNHGIYIAGQSQVLNNTVNHCFQGIVLALDPTTPSGLIKANGNTLSYIGNFPGCWGDQGTGSSPRYQGQPRAIQFNNSDAAGRAVEIKNNVIDDIDSEGLGGTVGIYTRLANSASIVDNNTITLSSGTSWAVDGGSQSVGMLLGWSYANGFIASNNHVNSTGYGMGIMVYGMGTAAKPMTLDGNIITGTNSTYSTSGDGTGIYIANQYLFNGTDRNESYVYIQNNNNISGFVEGIAVEKVATSTQNLTVIAHNNIISGNTSSNVKSFGAGTGTVSVDATCNWWGSTVPAEIAAKITGPATYIPYSISAGGACEGGMPVQVTRAGTVISGHSTIQSAIDAATTLAGDVINVTAGTYDEIVTINKAIILNGPNAGINPNTGTRVSEAILVSSPQSSGTNQKTQWHILANNVVIDGFFFDGSLFGSAIAISNWENNASAAPTLIQNLTIQNCRFQNYTRPVVSGSETYPTAISLSVATTGQNLSSGHLVTSNKFDNIYYVSSGGIYNPNLTTTAITFGNNLNGTISHNVITNVNGGIYLENINSGSVTVEDNSIQSYMTGIRNHYWAGTPTGTVNITNNAITAVANIPGFAVMQNCAIQLTSSIVGGTQSTAISGNTVTGNYFGIRLYNFNATSGYGSVSITNNSITGCTISVAPNIACAIKIDGSNAPALNAVTISGNNLSNNAGQLGTGLSIRNQTSQLIDATCNWWGSTVPAEIATKITGPATYIPYSVSAGGACQGYPVVVSRDNSFISGHTTIQSAIDETTTVSGDVINVAAGTYNEQVAVVNKTLSIIGADKSTTIIQAPATFGTWPGTGRQPVVYAYQGGLTMRNFTIDGMKAVPTTGSYQRVLGVYYLNSDGTLENCIVKGFQHATRTNDWDVYAVRVTTAPFGTENEPLHTVTIQNNEIFDFECNGIYASAEGTALTANLTVNILNNTITGGGAIPTAQNGIQLGGFYDPPSNPVPVSSISGVVAGNTIKDLWYTGAIYNSSGIVSPCRGIGLDYTNNILTNCQLGIAAIVSSNEEIDITGNNISLNWTNVPDGVTACGIYAEGTNFIIENNSISYDEIGVYRANSGAGSVLNTISHNSFIPYSGWSRTPAVTSYAVYDDGVNSIDATCNWYGTTNPSQIASRIYGNVTYVPYIVSNGGACEGAPVVVSRSGSFISGHSSIQAGIDAATAGDVLTIIAGNYDENVTVPTGKSLTINGSGGTVTLATGRTLSLSSDISFTNFAAASVTTAIQINNGGKVQDGIDFALVGCTVNVGAGTYNEATTISKSLSLLGPNAAINAVTGSRVAEAVLTQEMHISATSDVDILGFEFSSVDATSYTIDIQGNSSGFGIKNNRFVNNTKLAVNTGASSVTSAIELTGNLISGGQSGMAIGGSTGASFISSNKFINTTSGISVTNAAGLSVSENEISNTTGQGIQLSGNCGGVSVINNTVSQANTSHATSLGGIVLNGATFGGTVNIHDNKITDSYNGLAISGNIAGKDIQLHENWVSGTTNTGIYHAGTGTLDATLNYWDCPTVSGPVTYFPYYGSCTGVPGTFTFSNTITNVTAAATSSSICAGYSTTIYASGGSGYTWDQGLGQGTNKVVSPSSATTYQLTALDAHGCPGASASVSIAVNAAPVATISGTTTVAQGTSTTLTASTASSYSWSTGASTQSITVTPLGTTTYAVICSEGGCSSMASQVVTVATVDAGPSQFIAVGSSATLTASSSGISNPVYNWTYSGSGSAQGQSITVSPTVTTVYMVTAGGISDNVTVYVSPKPIADAGSDISIASGGNGILSGSASGSTAPYSFAWTTSNGHIVSGANTATPVVDLGGTYTLVVTDAFGYSSNPDAVVVTVVSTGYSVSGNVAYAFNPVNSQMHDVTITLKQGDVTMYTTTTPSSGTGNYQFLGVANGTYTVHLSSPKPWGGVTSADIIAMQNHYRTSSPVLLHGIKRLAGDVYINSSAALVDVNDRNKVNAKRINPNGVSFATGNWVFTKSADISTNVIPFANSGGYSDITITVSDAAVTQNFSALCYGDVDASHTGLKIEEAAVVDATADNGMELINYPNPFNDMTTISYAMPVEGEARVDIYNLMGNRVSVMEDPDRSEGTHRLMFSAGNLAPGIYIYVVTVKTSDDIIRQTGKMIITR